MGVKNFKVELIHDGRYPFVCFFVVLRSCGCVIHGINRLLAYSEWFLRYPTDACFLMFTISVPLAESSRHSKYHQMEDDRARIEIGLSNMGICGSKTARYSSQLITLLDKLRAILSCLAIPCRNLHSTQAIRNGHHS